MDAKANPGIPDNSFSSGYDSVADSEIVFAPALAVYVPAVFNILVNVAVSVAPLVIVRFWARANAT